MAQFFDRFPRVAYNLSEGNYPQFEMPVNIMVRLRVLTEKLDKIIHYYDYSVKEGQTPEIVAEKYYGTPEAHWLILMANNITDPLNDWVKHYDAFGKYIIDKYGSLAAAKSGIHHYEKIYKTVDNYTGTTNTYTVEIGQDEYDTLPVAEGSPIVYNVGNYTVDYYEPYRNSVTNYDWELAENEKRRDIKLIKKEYFPLIKLEFDNMMQAAQQQQLKSSLNFYRTVS